MRPGTPTLFATLMLLAGCRTGPVAPLKSKPEATEAKKKLPDGEVRIHNVSTMFKNGVLRIRVKYDGRLGDDYANSQVLGVGFYDADGGDRFGQALMVSDNGQTTSDGYSFAYDAKEIRLSIPQSWITGSARLRAHSGTLE